jgi:hypothetical protein
MVVSRAVASFHLMQIEQVIGGIDGDTSAQVVQLRMRFAGQSFIGSARIRAWDSAGANPVLLVDFTSSVSNSSAGDRVLVASPGFKALFPGIPVDATMVNTIPSAYLAAGKITFEEDSGTVLWSLAWGGAAFTGSNTGSTSNDSDGDFGAAFGGVLPGSGKEALAFTGAIGDESTTNVQQYALTANPTVRNNAGDSLTVSAPAAPPVLIYQGTGAITVGTPATLLKRTGKAFIVYDTATSSVTVVQTFKSGSGPHQLTLLNAVLQSIVTNGDKTTTLTRAVSNGTPGTAGYDAEFDDLSGPKVSLRTGTNPPSSTVAPGSLKGSIDLRDSTPSSELSLRSKITTRFSGKRTQAAGNSGETAGNIVDALKQELTAQGFTDVAGID